MMLLPVLVLNVLLPGQTDAPTYSIRPSAYVAGKMTGAVLDSPGTEGRRRVSYERISPLQLLFRAFDVQIDQISGPAWLLDPPDTKDAPLFDVDLEIPTGIDAPKVNESEILLRLLRERFGFRFHREARNFPAYDLVVADGGPKMVLALDRPVNGGPLFRRGIEERAAPFGKWGTIHIEGSATMQSLAEHLAYDINASNGVRLGEVTPRVADRTGLRWIYEFALDFRGRISLPSTVQSGDEAPGSGSDLFDALERELGLRLRKAADVTLSCIVIDNIDLPK